MVGCLSIIITIEIKLRIDGAPEPIIGRFGSNFDLTYFRCATSGVDLNDIRHAGKIFDVLGCDGTMHLRQPNKRPTYNYLVDSETLVAYRESDMRFCRK